MGAILRRQITINYIGAEVRICAAFSAGLFSTELTETFGHVVEGVALLFG
ncbi:hypothetical protein [Methylocaldum sp.]|nr:hypothetical protein [Methylocaldum sp.]HYE35663.1 hypothetical protein [Methylocaldum sp.]